MKRSGSARLSGARRCAYAFTLIELLVVIAVILILAAIMVPVVGVIMEKGRITRARGEAYEIVNAVTAFFHHYRKMPFPPDLADKHGAEDYTPDPNDPGQVNQLLDVYRVLQGHSGFTDQNPEQMAFLKTEKTLTAPLKDPWGNAYLISFDSDYDGNVELRYYSNDSGTWKWATEHTIGGQVCAVRSVGPNGTTERTNTVDDIITHLE